METVPEKRRFIESSSFYTNCENENPFFEMKIDNCNFLDEVPNRSNCPKCNKSRKYYCYTCYLPVEDVAKKLPFVSLPIKIDIIKHPKEVDGKSTSAHAAVLAPEDVQVFTYPNFPSYEDQQVLLIFPGPSAVPFEEWWKAEVQSSKNYSNGIGKLVSSSSEGTDTGFKPVSLVKDSNVKSCTKEQHGHFDFPFTKVVFIDSTWRQTKALYSDPRLKSLPCVVLSSYKSLFWRHQRGKPDTYLATIEAVYYFLREMQGLACPEETYRGQYDNMLFFFRHTYFKLRSVYDVCADGD